jgi:hypothetical protein
MAAPKPAPKPSKMSTTNYIRENYGFLAGFLAIPEVKNVLVNAARGKWSPSKLQGAVYATKWWKNTAEVTRQWTALNSTDPATANRRLADTKTKISGLAKQAGITLTPQQMSTFALNVNKFGWDEQQVQSAIGDQFHYNPEQAATGQAALTVDKLKEISSAYLVPISDATMNKWGQDVLGGEVDIAAFESYAKEQAKSMFPSLAAALDSGLTIRQYVDPYAEEAARMLEMNPAEIDFMDPKWRKAIDQIDPKTGVRTSMSLSDWGRTLRTDPTYNYDKTNGAREQASQLATRIAERFGAV